MKEASPKFQPTKCVASSAATGSRELVGGISPCAGQSGPQTDLFGQVLAPAKVSARPAKAKGQGTTETYGRYLPPSSESAALALCLANKLKQRLATVGSTEFAATWKQKHTPSGASYWAHIPLAPRTGDKGCSGWPTPMADTKATENYNEAGNTDSGRRTVELCGWPTCSARDWKDSEGMATEGVNPDGSTRKRLDMLPRVAQLAAWPTPDTQTCGGAQDAEKRKAGGHNVRLQDAVLLAGWATPSAAGSAGETSADLERVGNKWRNKKTGRILQTNLATDAKMLCGWATPRAEDAESAGMRHSRGVADTLTAQAGQGATSCPAGTGKRGVLNPNHSRWLMGYPLTWTLCGMLAWMKTKSARRSARSRSPSTQSGA